MDRRGIISLLGIKPYRLFFIARTASVSSDSMLPVALVAAALSAGFGTDGLGMLLGADVGAFVVFVLVGGAIADRFGPRRLMIGADVSRFLLQSGLAVTLLITSHPPLWWFLIGSGVHGAAAGLFQPGVGTVLPAITPGRIQEASGLLASATALTTVIGTAAAGGIVAAGGPQAVFMLDSVTYVVSAACLLRLRLPSSPKTAETRRWLADMADGWREFRNLTWFWTVIVAFALLSLVSFGPFWVVSASYLTRHHGAGGFGLLLTAEAMGSVFGGFSVARIRPRHPLRTAFMFSLLMTAPMLTLGLGAPLAISLVAMLVNGWARSIELVLWTTTEQTLVPAPVLNRLYAYDVAGCTSLLALGQALAGPESDLLGEQHALLACAGFLVAGCLSILAVPAVRNLVGVQQQAVTSEVLVER